MAVAVVFASSSATSVVKVPAFKNLNLPRLIVSASTVSLNTMSTVALAEIVFFLCAQRESFL
jgi:hypothetical protein